ncbi:DEAD/DEAH box helicase [Bacillus tuaregi]|uniref:DEAD/DEAH box helicase n=1 Tax=Bacillus tuaregi TaxID=1816695 RepID=UPI0008F8B38A|nr:DEAD/DEAH box helicase [Bacillus tuaregi]
MFFRRKQTEMKVITIPSIDGILIEFVRKHGRKETHFSLPLSKEEIEQSYRLPGFMSYVSWEELAESGFIENGILSYDSYYQLLQSDEGRTALQSLILPVDPVEVTGELRLDSTPDQAELSLKLMLEDASNLDRVGTAYGAMYQMDDELLLLPQNVYELKKAINREELTGYQKIGICQQLAREAGISLENFLENETYHVIDHYDLEVKVHAPDHIEVLPIGVSEEETYALNQLSQPMTSFKKGMKRNRFVRTEEVSEDITKLAAKRHITGEEVPLFFENPSAVLPEHDYQIDLELFSERVKGLIPIQHVRPIYNQESKMNWFGTDENASDDTVKAYEPEFLKGLMEQHPNEQYAFHEGKWYYLDPIMRKTLLDLPSDEEAGYSKTFTLDIRDNENELEYQLAENADKAFQQYPVSNKLCANLFEHQLQGYQWLCHLYEQGKGGLLADDMGLGKTIQVIAFLLRQKEQNRLKPTLIVLPIALIENWLEEIQKFASLLNESLYVHKGSSRLKSAEQIAQYEIILTSYDTLKIDQLILGKIDFQSIICDEAQNMKSHSSQRSRALRAMKYEFRLAMTGTPVENSLEELWSIMDFVQPGHLGSLKEFRRKYMEQADYEGLLKEIKPYYLRRTKAEVLDDRLPKKTILDPIYIEAAGVQKQISQNMLLTKETGQIAILNMLTKLRQLYGHPGVVIKDYENLSYKEIPKVLALIDLIEGIKVKNEKVLIFTEFRGIHSILKRLFMSMYGISIPVIDGQTKNRQSVVKQFNREPGFGIMLLSPKAAGVGLTITSVNHVIHYTRWWNPAVENQATDRGYRIGQTKDVFVYQLITTDKQNFPQGTVEELMHELLESKRELAENVIIPFDYSEIQSMVMEKMGMAKEQYV